MSWTDLPVEVWRLILGYVSTKDKLRSCSLASHKLHSAAVAATVDIDINVDERTYIRSDERLGERTKSLKYWLAQHGRHVHKLNLVKLSGHLTQLPCPNLQNLVLSNCSVQIRPSSDCPGTLATPTGLTSLVLGCDLQGSAADASADVAALGPALAALTGLQHLELRVDGRSQYLDPLPQLESTVLQQLTNLTHLRLGSGAFTSAAALQHISCLQQLQELTIEAPDCNLSTTATPGFSLLTALTSLRMGPSSGALEPDLLGRCTQLCHLSIHGCAVEPAFGDLQALLAAIGALQQLETLHFNHLRQYWWPAVDVDRWTPEVDVDPADEESPAAAAAAEAALALARAAYGALTASSKLRSLQLDMCALPDGAWHYIFPAGRSCAALRKLHAHYVAPSGNGPDAYAEFPVADAAACSLWDVHTIVGCCPGLQDVSLCLKYPNYREHEYEDVDYNDDYYNDWVPPLRQLKQLTSLRLIHLPGKQIAELAVLTGLQDLHCNVAEPWPCVTTLLQLKELKRLKVLSVQPQNVNERHYGPGYHSGKEDPNVRDRRIALLHSLFVRMFDKGSSTEPVWLQLLRHCTDWMDPLHGTLNTVTLSLAQQVQQQQDQLAEQQAALTQAQLQQQEQQQQLQRQQAQLAELQAALAQAQDVQQQEHRELRQQLQGLAGQLAEQQRALQLSQQQR